VAGDRAAAVQRDGDGGLPDVRAVTGRRTDFAGLSPAAS
jgi:hypothetical protein